MKQLLAAALLAAVATPAGAGVGNGANPGTVVGNVYESAQLTGFGLSLPSPCGRFAFDPCPSVRPHKHPRPH
jgi:hypothetical protein